MTPLPKYAAFYARVEIDGGNDLNSVLGPTDSWTMIRSPSVRSYVTVVGLPPILCQDQHVASHEPAELVAGHRLRRGMCVARQVPPLERLALDLRKALRALLGPTSANRAKTSAVKVEEQAVHVPPKSRLPRDNQIGALALLEVTRSFRTLLIRSSTATLSLSLGDFTPDAGPRSGH